MLLGCFISCGGMGWGADVVRAEFSSIKATEVSASGDTKSITIFYVPENMDGFCASVNSNALRKAKLPYQLSGNPEFGLRSQDSSAPYNVALIIWGWNYRGIVDQPYGDGNYETIGGRLAAVFDDYYCGGGSVGCHPTNGYVRNENIGPQLFFGRATSENNRFLGRVGGVFSRVGGDSGIIQTRADEPQLYPKEPSLDSANTYEKERKESRSILREPSRPHEFAIWGLGLLALVMGFGGGYLLCRAGGLLR